MKSSVIITMCICCTAIVVSTVGALAFIAVGRDGNIVPQIVTALGQIITVLTVLGLSLGKDVVQNVVPILGKSVQTSTTVTSNPAPTAAAVPASPSPEEVPTSAS